MKKCIYLILSLLLIPIMVNGETLTYDVCDTCEYTRLNNLEIAINNIPELNNKDIIININQDSLDGLGIGDSNNIAKSITINANNHSFNNYTMTLYADKVIINDVKNINEIMFFNSNKIIINRSNISSLNINDISKNGISKDSVLLNDKLELDQETYNNLKGLILIGNYKIINQDFKNILIQNGGLLNIYDSQIAAVLNIPQISDATINIYNTKFNSLKYKNITSNENADSELNTYFETLDLSTLSNNILDLNLEEFNGKAIANTTVYFDKEAKLKPSDKLNLADYLDYYTEDKEIDYTIEDESIAKIENKELIALKEGSTKVTVTTDDGHVVYNINLVVEKETIPEKIDKMTIKVPITGSKVKAWVIVVSVLLLGVIGICSYMLIRRKK